MLNRLARAKINLALHVTGRQADGFHLLDSIVCFADFGDELSVEPADTLSLTITGPMAKSLPSGQDNLVLRAANLMETGQGAALTLIKNLPIASGIGGGSSDAAATLHLLAELWQSPLPSPADLLKLGADIPVCLAGKPSRMRGIGEEVSPIKNFPGFDMVLVNPSISVPTPTVFAALDNRQNPSLDPQPTSNDPQTWLEYLSGQRNDLERPAQQIEPAIKTVLNSLQQLESCALARMSGSGATCFGLFQSTQEAADAALTIKAAHPDWWVQTTRATT